MRKIWKKKQVASQGPDIYQQMNNKLWLNNIKLSEQPHLTISEWCHKHIIELHKEYPNEEWLALCKVEKRGPGDFYLTDMIHPEQSTSTGSVTATDDGMEWAVKELQERWEDMWLWNCVLHSHHKMGVFWSWTDDNARKDLNDGRFMAFAVVTAYKLGKDNEIDVDYKWCLNFYKPYNIEIDCDMYYEDGVLDENYELYIDEYIKARDEIFENKVKEKQDEMNELMVQPDYSRVIDYLGMDIKEVLDENYRTTVMVKMPNPQVESILKTCENEAKKEAEEKMKEDKVLMDAMAEYSAWSQWSTDLKAQLEEHKKIKAKVYNWWDDYRKSYTTPQSITPQNRFFDDLDDDDMNDGRWWWYTTKRYPTSDELRVQLGLKPDVSVIQVNWTWKVFSKTQNRYIWADEFDEEEDWESCVWSEAELEELEKEKGKKKEKTPEEKWEDVLHWLYN